MGNGFGDAATVYELLGTAATVVTDDAAASLAASLFAKIAQPVSAAAMLAVVIRIVTAGLYADFLFGVFIFSHLRRTRARSVIGLCQCLPRHFGE